MRFIIPLFLVAVTVVVVDGAITRDECIAQGGEVVGDTGSGDIRQEGYECTDGSGPPTDQVQYVEGEAVSFEGEVCCDGTGPGIDYSTIEVVSHQGDETGMIPEGGGLPVNDDLISCVVDDDCITDEEYCSQGYCQEFGCCNSVIDCYNPSNEFFHIECAGPYACSDNLCGRDCSSMNLCPVGFDVQDCFVAPCQNDPSDDCTENPVSCQDNYCGGCNAIRYNAAGHHVCKSDTAFPGATNANGMEGMIKITSEECTSQYDGVVVELLPGTIVLDFLCGLNNDENSPFPIGYIAESDVASETRSSDIVTDSVCCLPTGGSSTELPPNLTMTREQCTDEFGGNIVGDIGNGNIFEEGYICESDGLPPMGDIVQDAPSFAIEGEVCCGTAITSIDIQQVDTVGSSTSSDDTEDTMPGDDGSGAAASTTTIVSMMAMIGFVLMGL